MWPKLANESLSLYIKGFSVKIQGFVWQKQYEKGLYRKNPTLLYVSISLFRLGF